ncbi:KilA-N domain-containing protein [Vibrio fluvialis]|nr:KilA-N domain-containing protein [Vibrio fluvialis]EKO3524366.1 KilA-N domain-containing protein [Vibrio fluvialis]EKO3528611.1 KilA-N domain-containing protein [Vibrio fluvialis]
MTNLTILSNKIRFANGLYSLNDLHKASGSKPTHKPANFIRLETTQELIREIHQAPTIEVTNFDCCSDLSNTNNRYPDLDNARNINSSNLRYAVKTKQGGKDRGTWVCKELVYAYAMWISAKFHLQVIRAFDAMVAAPQPVNGVMLSENQAGFVKCSFNLMDKLQADYQQTQQQYQAMQQQLTMMRSFCDQMEANLNQFNDRLNSNFNVVSHLHLYKKMAMDYEGARELKNFMERTH